MRKILFAALLAASAIGVSALVSGPAGAVINNQSGGGSSGHYCTGSLKSCLAGCRSGQSPANYTYCHTNCILLNQNCLGYPMTKGGGKTKPVTTKPIGTAPVANKPPPVVEDRGVHSRH
jgi:hypothetical protein